MEEINKNSAKKVLRDENEIEDEAAMKYYFDARK